MLSKHRNTAKSNLSCAVVTVSDTRNKETDKSGQRIIELLKAESHRVDFYEIIPDDKEVITQTFLSAINNESIHAVVINGGTGVSYRDVTIEAIQPVFDKELPGFGELFRHLSYQDDIGTASILSRAICGIANHKVIFSIPGSTGAVQLAMEKIILPEVGHIVSEINKDRVK